MYVRSVVGLFKFVVMSNSLMLCQLSYISVLIICNFCLLQESEEDKLRDRFQLDSCLIRVDPQLSLSIEHLRYPENLVAQLGLDVDFSEDGLVIAGKCCLILPLTEACSQ